MKNRSSILLGTLMGMLLTAGFYALDFRSSEYIATLEARHADLLRQVSPVSVEAHPIPSSRLSTSSRKTPEEKQAQVQKILSAWNALDDDVKSNPIHDKKSEIYSAVRGMDTEQLLALWSASGDSGDELMHRVLEQLALLAPSRLLSFDPGHNDALLSRFKSIALMKLAEANPLQAQEWLAENAAGLGWTAGEMQTTILLSAQRYSPALAFQILDTLQEHTRMAHLNTMVSQLNADDPLSQLLPLCRDFIQRRANKDTAEKAMAKALQSFARPITSMSYEEGIKVIDSFKLTLQEKDALILGINPSSTDQGTKNGLWLEWIGENSSPGSATSNIQMFMTSWAAKNFEAPGIWLQTTDDGPVKSAAIAAYVGQISNVDHVAALEWAISIPSNHTQMRSQALNSVYRNWPPDNPEGKAAFGQEHGL